MGGHAFEPEGLKTPRIPTELYDRLKKEYAEALAPFYNETQYAEEVPDKPDHGDVDILAQGPHDTTSPELITKALNARAFKRNGAVTNYAIPHPSTPSAYIQLDVQETPPGYLPWQRFQASYGDLSQILGVIHRPLGLTATDRGLHVRIPAIEPTNKKASLLHLSHDPAQVLPFLGLSLPATGFPTEAAVFAWAASSRFFHRSAVVAPPDRRPDSENHNDRARRAKRGMYRRFIDDWIPAHPDVGAACVWTRETVLAEALEVFGVRGEHDERLARWWEERREEALWRAIKEVVPRKRDSLALVVRGLKRWVSVDEGGMVVLLEEPLVGEKRAWVRGLGEGGEEAVLKWVGENWELVQRREKEWAGLQKVGGLANGAMPLTEGEKEAKKLRLEEV